MEYCPVVWAIPQLVLWRPPTLFFFFPNISHTNHHGPLHFCFCFTFVCVGVWVAKLAHPYPRTCKLLVETFPQIQTYIAEYKCKENTRYEQSKSFWSACVVLLTVRAEFCASIHAIHKRTYIDMFTYIFLWINMSIEETCSSFSLSEVCVASIWS